MKKIKLTQEKYALVDDSDYKWLNNQKWCYRKGRKDQDGYAVYTKYFCDGKIKRTVRMHCLLNSTGHGIYTDHREGNTLNNQRYNLRGATSKQNSYNQKSAKNATSKYKGVHWYKGRTEAGSKWTADVNCNGTNYYLGLFICEIEAAKAYNKKAKHLFGSYARLNKVE